MVVIHFPSRGKTLVTGITGQVGGSLVRVLGARALPATRLDLPLDAPAAIEAKLDALHGRDPIGAVINPAAYTQVDKAEQETELARLINVEAPGALARWCAKRGVPFVHFSTDYVYSGEGGRPWVESDPVAPQNVYGRTKLGGEQKVVEAFRESGGRYLIFRTSWVYDAWGKNFVNTMLRLGKEREQLKVVADQFGAPTYAPQLAEAALQALNYGLKQPEFPSGIYHLANRGETSWHGFAQAIFQRARGKALTLAVKEVLPIPAADYPTPARRPANSRLNQDKAERMLGVRMPDWQAGLDACMGEISS